MAIASALLLLAALPESGAVMHARATARIVAAEEIDFARPDIRLDARPDGRAELFRLLRTRNLDLVPGPDGISELRLIEFQ